MPALDRENWMKYLDTSERVIDSYIAASHDASAYKVDGANNSGNVAAGAITQAADYTAQLLSGSRYFDMRITVSNGQLLMKHNILTFDTFENVLLQLKTFATSHPSEFLFLDLDFDNGTQGLGSMILAALIQILGDGSEAKFATAHVNADGMYNTGLTWDDLVSDGKQYVIIWQEGADSGKAWAPKAENIRDNFDDDFNEKTPEEITASLDVALSNWPRKKLFLTQLINTPFLSILPWAHPTDKDEQAAPIFNDWLAKRQKGDRLGVVKRDFVNEGWNQPGIEYVIRLNRFTTEPNLPLGDAINYLDTIRLRTEDGRYVSVDVQPAGNGLLSSLRLVDEPTDDAKFLLRHYKYDSSWGWPYSGNLDADSCGANGNLRLVHLDTRTSGNVGNDTVLSIYGPGNNVIYWGVSWARADNLETFLPYDPANTSSSYQIYDGSKMLIRSLSHQFWEVREDENLVPRIFAIAIPLSDATTFIVEKAKA